MKQKPFPFGCLVFLGVVWAIAFGLGGCGKRGDPTVPKGTPDLYPRTYPPAS